MDSSAYDFAVESIAKGYIPFFVPVLHRMDGDDREQRGLAWILVPQPKLPEAFSDSVVARVGSMVGGLRALRETVARDGYAQPAD